MRDKIKKILVWFLVAVLVSVLSVGVYFYNSDKQLVIGARTATILSASEVALVQALDALATSGASQAIRKSGSSTLANVDLSSSSVSSNSLDFDEFVNSMTLDANLLITRGGFYIGIGGAGQTVFDVQGTASASYLISRNTLQVNGLASAAYSRFGTNTTTGSFLSTANDLLISGKLEADSSVSFDAGIKGSGLTDCDSAGSQLLWDTTSGKFTCETLADGDIPDTITLSGGTIGSNNISGTQTTTGTLTIGDNGDAVNFDTSTWDVTAGAFSGITTLTMSGHFSGATASLSGNFQTSGRIIGGASSHSFAGSLEPDSNGLHTIGTTAKKWAQAVINKIIAVVKFVLPVGSPTVDEIGAIGGKTASASQGAFLRVHDGTAVRVINNQKCVATSLSGSDLTAKNQWTIFTARDPFSIDYVQSTASGSNSLGWNLKVGSATVPTTSVFTLNKSASGSGITTYETINNATVGDPSKLDFVVSSTSATLDSVYVKVCMYQTASPNP